MAATEQQTAFMTKLRQEWSAEHEGPGSRLTNTYEFRGMGSDTWEIGTYNSWLEHRHGWPIDGDGMCVTSYPCCSEHADTEPLAAEECPTCQTILRWFREDQVE